MSTTDLLALKLYVDDDGQVWYIYSDGPTIRTKQTVIEFLLRPLCHSIPHLRLVGMAQNAPLIVPAFHQRLKADHGMVEVCSPLVCQTEAERHDPARVLYAMRQYERAASAGGWHRLTKDDYTSLVLVSHLRTYGKVDDHARRLLRNHPVWAPLSFIPHLDRDACCKLLALIVDPRFYVNPTSMSRGSRLRAFLGLDLPTMRGVMGEGPAQRYHTRCKLVVDSWRGLAEPDYKLVERPDNFLYRVKRDRGEAKGSVIGTLRATQTFAEYLRLTWLAACAVGRPSSGDGLFIPRYFFNKEYETNAFYDHFKKVMGE